VAAQADILILAVKPYQFEDVIPVIKGCVKEDAIVVSIAAGQTLANIERLFGKTVKLVRTMPNTPALVQAGATGMCFHETVTEEEQTEIIRLFESFGIVAVVAENMIDTVIGVSGIPSATASVEARPPMSFCLSRRWRMPPWQTVCRGRRHMSWRHRP